MTQTAQKITSFSWYFLARVLSKTIVLLFICNIIFAFITPIEQIGRLTLYNWLLPGRSRLPYGEQTAASYNLTLNNIPAMFASHDINQQKTADEYRVLLLGDSNTWGWLLENEETLAGQLNNQKLFTTNGRKIVVYNLGYPIMSLSKDLLILDEARHHQPDLIIWLVSLESFAPEQQLVHPIVQNNHSRLQPLISRYNLAINPKSEEFTATSLWDRTIFGQRRPLADLLRLQSYGFAWASTGIDQEIPSITTMRQSDFKADQSWQSFSEPTTLTADDLAFDILAAGVAHAADTPLIIINEPIYRSDGQNSDLRYNSFYPRWAYDQYRHLLSQQAKEHNWTVIDLWDAIPSEEFTDTPLHLTPQGTAQLANQITPILQNNSN